MAIFRAGIRMEDRILFFRSLATMFESGISIHQALESLAEQLPNPIMQAAARALTLRVESGVSLDRAMAGAGDTFKPLEVGLVTVGMRTGSLGLILDRIALCHEKLHALSRRTAATLVPPLITLAICLLLMVLVPPYLFSGLFRMLADSGAELPWISRALIAYSEAVRSPWFWGGAGLLAALVVGFGPGLLHRERLRLRELALSIKWLGPMLRSLAVARFARTFTIVMEAGMSIDKALPMAATASGDPVWEHRLPLAVKSLLEGELLPDSLAATGFFPGLFLTAVAAGQEAGSLSIMLNRIAGLYELEVEHRQEVLSAAMGPVVTVFIGLIVGALNLAILLPLVRFVDAL